MPWYDVDIEIIDIQGTGKCNAEHKIGDNFEGIDDQRKICSAAYHTLYPYIVALRSGGSFPWEDNPDEVTLCCPDYKNPVVFKLTRKSTQ